MPLEEQVIYSYSKCLHDIEYENVSVVLLACSKVKVLECKKRNNTARGQDEAKHQNVIVQV